MAGRISPPNMEMCCKQAFTVCKDGNPIRTRRIRLRKIMNKLQMPLCIIFVVGLIIFVLIITSKKPDKITGRTRYFESAVKHTDNSDYHYGIVIDCGSSGSRVFIYYWPSHNGNPEELLKIEQMVDLNGSPVRMKIRPGIASFADKPQNASDYLRPLLNFAASHVPRSKHRETPLYILATAGMRLLPIENQKVILSTLRKEIPKKYSFHLTESQVEVISGKQEGIYLWIAINYILGRFDHSDDVGTTPISTVAHVHRKQTVGCIEMGGASVQIAFEVPQSVSLPKDLAVNINLGCDSHRTTHEYKVYVTTFLGFGTTAARSGYLSSLLKKNFQSLSKKETIPDPCLPLDLTDDGRYRTRLYKLKGSGDFKTCQKDLLPLMNTSVECSRPPCSLNGVHQPPINFNNSEFFGFAEFWYSTDDVLRIGGQYEDDKMDALAKEFCKRSWDKHKKHYAMGFYPKADEHRFKYQCFKSAWMTTVLHDGFKFPRGYKGFQSALHVKGKELQWTLGAILYRTRFMPLREIQQNSLQSAKPHDELVTLWITLDHQGFFAVLFLCCMIVLGAVIIYCRRLRRYSKTANLLTRTYEPKPSPTYPQDLRVKV